MVDLWLYATKVATVSEERRNRMRLRYTNEAIERWGLGSRVLTVSQPVTLTPLTPAPTAAIIEGLLPEGDALERLTSQFGDSLGLLAVLGRETVGAVVVVPEGEAPPTAGETPLSAPLSETDIAARLRGLAQAPLGVSRETDVRLSLGGAQPKLPLTYVSGEYHDPSFSRPSTRILKPEPGSWPGLVELEAWGLTLLKTAEVPVPDFWASTYDGIKVLIVDRYDRDLTAEVDHRRIHQEDLCMALGVRPAEKYALSARAKTSLARMARAIHDNSSDPTHDLQVFLKILVTNIAIGNCDAHARNLSLIHGWDGTIRLAPAYDVIPTFAYATHSNHLAQPINRDVFRPETVTWQHLLAETALWDVPVSASTVSDAVDAVGAALERFAVPDGYPTLSRLVASFDRLKDSH